jgi:hypothetical protein
MLGQQDKHQELQNNKLEGLAAGAAAPDDAASAGWLQKTSNTQQETFSQTEKEAAAPQPVCKTSHPKSQGSDRFPHHTSSVVVAFVVRVTGGCTEQSVILQHTVNLHATGPMPLPP